MPGTTWSAGSCVPGCSCAPPNSSGRRVTPPTPAPTQVVVMAVKPDVVDAAHRLGEDLRQVGVRVVVDDRADVPFGRRAVDWELKGVPVRLELGPRDVAAGQVTAAFRLANRK